MVHADAQPAHPGGTAADAVLARRLDAVACAYMTARYSGPGNPMGTQILRRGDLVATKVPFVPGNPLMNRVTGIETPNDLAEVLAFYAATQQLCWVETTPATPVDVTTALVAHGFRIVGHGSSLYAQPLPAPRAARAGTISVQQVDSALRDVFLDTLNTGFGTPAAQLDGLRRNQSFWTDVADWHLFLARDGDTPVGAAVLSMHDGCGYLAAAATLTAQRRRGVQAALIDARIERARALGATLVTGQAEWGTSSQANMQRAGLQICHVRTHWSNHPSP